MEDNLDESEDLDDEYWKAEPEETDDGGYRAYDPRSDILLKIDMEDADDEDECQDDEDLDSSHP